jgi:hypothetical protein
VTVVALIDLSRTSPPWNDFTIIHSLSGASMTTSTDRFPVVSSWTSCIY